MGLYLILTTTGITLLNLGGNAGSMFFTKTELNFNINWISLAGIFCYIISFILFTRIITANDVSFIYPILMGSVQILTLTAAYFILKEDVSIYGFIGIALIIAGIVLMNVKR